MVIFKKYIIKYSTEINTSPEKIWDFFYNLESNYQKWHPTDHQFFRWIRGKSLEVGSKFDSKEIVAGHKTKLKGVCIESVKNKKIVFKPIWPISFICPKIEWDFEQQGKKTIFTAQTHLKFGRIFLALKKDAVKELMEISKKHMDEEGMNLKNILEIEKWEKPK